MKKNFFKKLSFVMALAMIISVIAPAAGAFAATGAHLNATKKYLYLAEENRPTSFDFNIVSKPAGAAKFVWTSSKPDVASVESPSGVVTAEAKGTATVKVAIKDKAGKTLKTLSATVVVRDNIDTLKISNFTDKTVVKVGETFDFNRTFTTFSGSTTATSSITRYAVDSDKATIDATTGKFTPTAAGDFNVTAYAFMSTYEYTKWLADKADSWVLAKDTVKVTVAPSVVSTTQLDTDSFKVTFDSDMSKSDFATTLVLYQVVGDTSITTGAEKISKVTYDATGKEATVDVLAAFSANSTYKFVAGALTGTFKAASATLADVKTIVFDDFNVDIAGPGYDMLDSVKGLNADGVAILTGDALGANVSFTYGGDFTKGFTSNNMAYIYVEGYSTTITAKFSNYVYDTVQQKYVEVTSSDAAVATGNKADNGLKNSSISFVLNTGAAVDVNTTGWGSAFSVPANDGVFTIHYRYQLNSTTDGTYTYDDAGLNDLTFTSSDPDKLLVTTTGTVSTMVPLAQGPVTVLAKNADGVVVSSFSVTVVPARSFVSATADVSGITLGNSTLLAGDTENKDVKITVKDSMNESFVADVQLADISVTNAPAGVDKAATGLAWTITPTAENTITINTVAAGVTPGAYTVKVAVHGLNNVTKDVYYTVIVLSAASVTVTRWVPELDATTVDLKDIVATDALNVHVYGYNAAGARVAVLGNDEFEVAVQLNGSAVTDNVVSTDAADTLNVAFDNAGTLELFAKGTYVVTVKSDNAPNATLKVDGAVLGYLQLTVTDTTATTQKLVHSSIVAADFATVDAAVLEAFDFTLNGDDIDANAVQFAFFTSDGTVAVADHTGDATVANTTLYIDHVTYTVTTLGVARVYTIDVKKTIAIK